MPTEDKKQNILADYLPHGELAAQLDVHPRTLERWRVMGIGPPVTRIGREPYYNINTTRKWLRSREQKMPRERRPARGS